jgi:hypothetical protein
MVHPQIYLLVSLFVKTAFDFYKRKMSKLAHPTKLLKVGTRPCLTTFASYYKRVPEEGLEPSLHYWKRILSPQRLPFRHSGNC